MAAIISKFSSDEKGATTVEFALITIAFLTIIYGLFESGRLMMATNSFQAAVEESTRYAMVQENYTEQSLTQDVAAIITTKMTESGISGEEPELDISVNYTTAGGVNFIEVDAYYTFSPVIPLPVLPDSWDSISLRAKSRQVLFTE